MVNILRKAHHVAKFDRERFTTDGTWSLDENGLLCLANPITAVNVTNIAYQAQYDIHEVAGPDMDKLHPFVVSSPDLSFDLEADSSVEGWFDNHVSYSQFRLLLSMEESKTQLNGRYGWTQLSNCTFTYEIPNRSREVTGHDLVGVMGLSDCTRFEFWYGILCDWNIYGDESDRGYCERQTKYPGVSESNIVWSNCLPNVTAAQNLSMDECIELVEQRFSSLV